MKELEEFEETRKAKYNKERKKELIEMEHIGQNLCQEHSKVIHQIEHINWHLSHAHPHEITTPIELPHIPPKICHVDGIISGHGHGHIHGKLHCSNKPSANMVRKNLGKNGLFNMFLKFVYNSIFVTIVCLFYQFFPISLFFSLLKGLSTNKRWALDQNNFRIAT